MELYCTTLSFIVLPVQVYLNHGSISSKGTACQGPDINPKLLDEVCAWRVRTCQGAVELCTVSELWPVTCHQQ